jgi:hypothetical protein
MSKSESEGWVRRSVAGSLLAFRAPPAVQFEQSEGLSDTYLSWAGPAGAVFSVYISDKPIRPEEMWEEAEQGVDVTVVRDQVEGAGGRSGRRVELRLHRDIGMDHRALVNGTMVHSRPEHVIECSCHLYWALEEHWIRVGYWVREDASPEIKRTLVAMLNSTQVGQK